MLLEKYRWTIIEINSYLNNYTNSSLANRTAIVSDHLKRAKINYTDKQVSEYILKLDSKNNRIGGKENE